MKKLVPVLLIIFLFSCGKADRDLDISNFDSKDNGLSEFAFADVFNIVNLAIENESGLRSSTILNCASVLVDTTGSVKTILVDFGTTNCLGIDGRNRRGIIYGTFTGKFRDSLTVITITTNNYFLNDYKIDGNEIITNKGQNSSGNLWFTRVTQNAFITDPAQSYTISFTANRKYEWIAGESTFSPADDEYLITGSAEGTNRKGNDYEVEITNALHLKLNCAYLVSGKITITPENLNPRYVDFGNGTCDNLINVTINGAVFDVEIN